MPKPATAPRPRGVLDRALGAIEAVGNWLPHPATLFAILSAAVVLASAIAAALDVAVVHPGTGETIRVENLLSVAGLHRLLGSLVTNFVQFAPLGTVLVAMLGIAVAEGSGLIAAAIKLVVLSSPTRLLTWVVVFAGVMSNTAGDVGYVLLVPLAGTVFLAAGRHPLAGIFAAFAGVSGGFSANLLLGTIDPLLAGLTEEAAHIVDSAVRVNATANYYFMAVSTLLVTAVGAWITDRVVVPRLGPYAGSETSGGFDRLTPEERRGLAAAAAAAAAFAGVLLLGTVPSGGFLRDPATGSLLRSPFMSGIVALIFAGGVIVGLAYGIAAGTMRRDKDVIAAMSKSMETMALYLVLVFFAAQFVALFNWTHLGLVVAVHGARALEASGLGGPFLLGGFVVLTSIVNLAIGSASAKWAIMAPVFVPMFMLLGLSPELTQAAYRVGDSATNVLSPMMSYFPLVVAYVQRYEPRAGIGTVVASMLPFSATFLVSWFALLVVWYLLGLPLGPGAELVYPAR